MLFIAEDGGLEIEAYVRATHTRNGLAQLRLGACIQDHPMPQRQIVHTCFVQAQAINIHMTGGSMTVYFLYHLLDQRMVVTEKSDVFPTCLLKRQAQIGRRAPARRCRLWQQHFIDPIGRRLHNAAYLLQISENKLL